MGNDSKHSHRGRIQLSWKFHFANRRVKEEVTNILQGFFCGLNNQHLQQPLHLDLSLPLSSIFMSICPICPISLLPSGTRCFERRFCCPIPTAHYSHQGTLFSIQAPNFPIERFVSEGIEWTSRPFFVAGLLGDSGVLLLCIKTPHFISSYSPSVLLSLVSILMQ